MDISPVHTKVDSETGNPIVTTDLPENQTDINNLYEKFLQSLPTKSRKATDTRKALDPKQAQEDFFRLFRTRVVLFWMGTNALLIMTLTTPEIAAYLNIEIDGNGGNISGVENSNPYMAFILWSVAALSLVRFVGSVVYLILP
jgi:chitin synthase